MSTDNKDSDSPPGTESHHRMSYRDVAMHKVMLQDVVRTDAYQRAINQGCQARKFSARFRLRHRDSFYFRCASGRWKQ